MLHGNDGQVGACLPSTKDWAATARESLYSLCEGQGEVSVDEISHLAHVFSLFYAVLRLEV